MKKLLEKFFVKKQYIVDMFSGTTDLTLQDKKAIAWLVEREEFRKFEKYLQSKQRARGKRMLYCEEKEMKLLRRDISMLAEITADVSRFWKEVNDVAGQEEKQKKKIKLFGKDKVRL